MYFQEGGFTKDNMNRAKVKYILKHDNIALHLTFLNSAHYSFIMCDFLYQKELMLTSANWKTYADIRLAENT